MVDNIYRGPKCYKEFQEELTVIATSRPSLQAFTCYAGPRIIHSLSLQWLVDSPSPQSLHSLSIMFKIDAPKPFGPLLHEAGPSLEHLSLEVEGTPMTHWIGSNRYEHDIDLSQLKNLKSLLIRANVDPGTLLYHWLPQIPSTSLSLLVIVLSNIHWCKKYFAERNLPALFDHLPYLRSDRTRIVFANDPLDLSHESISEDEEEEAAVVAERAVIQTVDMLKSYLDEVFGASGSSFQYEVMNLSEASRLGTALPIDL